MQPFAGNANYNPKHRFVVYQVGCSEPHDPGKSSWAEAVGVIEQTAQTNPTSELIAYKIFDHHYARFTGPKFYTRNGRTATEPLSLA